MPSVLLVPDLPIEHWPAMDRYALRLTSALRESVPHVDVRVAGDIDDLTEAGQAQTSTRTSAPHDVPVDPTLAFHQLRRHYKRYKSYPRHVRHMEGADVMHVLDHSYAHMLKAKQCGSSVVSVHDLMPVLTVQRKATRLRERVRNRAIRWMLENLRNADAFIVATEWLREELGEWLGTDDNIFVVPYGVDEGFFAQPKEDPSLTRERWKIPANAFVVLHVGTVGARKNFNAVIAAVDGLRRADMDVWLLQVGGTLTEEHRADIDARDLAHRVVSLGVASESDLHSAYRVANVLLFPSLHEGFGFPVLEAMASELPVVTSGAAGLAEVGGEAAVIIGGREVEPYVKAVERIHNEESHRKDLIRHGVENARKYRWSKSAQQTAQVYQAVS